MFLLTIFLKCLCSIIYNYITHYLMFMGTSVSPKSLANGC